MPKVMQVNLNWTPVPPSAGAVRYDVFRSVSGGPFNKVGETPDGSTTSYVDTTVVEGNTYNYVVKAVNLAGASGSSNVAATPPVPPPPTGLVATVTAV